MRPCGVGRTKHQGGLHSITAICAIINDEARLKSKMPERRETSGLAQAHQSLRQGIKLVSSSLHL